jgi:hypothetical protein
MLVSVSIETGGLGGLSAPVPLTICFTMVYKAKPVSMVALRRSN